MEKILELKHVSKTFSGVKAISRVNLNVYKGKVMGLLGENGAGKSTLVKILSGVYVPDEGQILFNGQLLPRQSIRTAQKAGISIIHQELSLCPSLDIAENIFLDRLPTNRIGKIRWKEAYRETEKLLQRVQVSRTAQTRVKDLRISEQQLVEIAKIIKNDFQVLIMDEPTDSLTDKETENLFSLIQKLTAAGKSVIYITHRLNEVFRICDDVTVLRDGKLVCEKPSSEMNEEKLIRAMVGRELKDQFPSIQTEQKKLVLDLQGLGNQKIQNIHLQIYAGETLGLVGLIGAGRTELAKTIFGVYPQKTGKMLYKNAEIQIRSPKSAIQKKILYVSEDRKSEGLILRLSVAKNMVLSSLQNFESRFKRILHRLETRAVREYIKKFHIKTPSLKQRISMLSGGNQQKVSIARALLANPEVLILDEPTRGIDIGAKKEIYELINELKKQGLAIVLISSEMPEILGLSDRIAVMCNGKITGVFGAAEISQEQLLQYATSF